MSLVEEGAERKIRMANLAIVGSHSTNGVAAIHSELLRTVTVKDLAEMFPERFNNKTNGVTPRRWLLLANPALAGTITDAIGDGWITDLGQLAPAHAARRRQRACATPSARPSARPRRSSPTGSRRRPGQTVDPDTIFDSQVKRIHEYKRQLLNALRIVVLYNRLRENPDLEMTPRTFFFAGKAAPAYHLAKLIIKFLNNLAGTIDGDPAVRGRLKVVFLPEYCVSLAERLIPASDVSNQISTAGYEASGTSNMKFMMNGALTIGTRDGATIEMAQEAGEENFFLFGLTAEQVAGSRGWYSPHWHYDHEPETRAALDLIFSDHFSRNEPGVFAPLRDALLTHGRPLHAPGGPHVLSRGGPAAGRSCTPTRGMGAQGHPERGGLREVLQRPHHRRVRGRHLARQAVPGARDGAGDGPRTWKEAVHDLAAGGSAGPEGSMLVDLARLERAYYERKPDTGRPDSARRLRHERASRLAAARLVHRGPHRWPSPRPSATTGAARASTARCTWARTRTRCPSPAQRTGARGAGGERRGDDHPARRRRDADAGHLARDPRLQPRPRAAPGRRHRRHAVAQPARGRRLQVQPAQRRPGRHRRDGGGFRTGPTRCCARATPASSACRSPQPSRPRPRTRKTSSCPTSTICANVVDMDAIRGAGLALGGRPARRRGRAVLGADQLPSTSSTSPS